jgi:NADPH:quinone reductase-like Zn-dependent oxidoreductase
MSEDGHYHNLQLISTDNYHSIGQYAIQIATLWGYKVITSCSPSKASFVKALGAEQTFDYKLSLDEQVDFISKATGGNFSKIFDTAASPTNTSAALTMLEKVSKPTGNATKKFTSTDDWSPMEAPKDSGIEIYQIHLGLIGRWGEGDAEESVNAALVSFIEPFEQLVGEGKIKPMEYIVIGNGFEGVSDAIKLADSGANRGKKCLVKLGET